MQRLHLVANAHLDPFWLWDWEEGAAEAVSTFRAAADFCEEFDGFVFNHNEVILYKWVELFDPALFRRIQALVAQGKWHIMGGWFLQPDCNMPSGEGIVRQIIAGRRYFSEKFDAKPTTAINFDSFGHSRGLVQILVKAGFDSYVHTRPHADQLELPGREFVWIGYDGSEVVVHRSEGYGSGRGHAHEKVEGWLKNNLEVPVGMVLWGVGNHGGGPTRLDLQNLAQLMQAHPERTIAHSTPERYFADLDRSALPRVETSLNATMVGCYTSEIRIKQAYRRLENDLLMAEKMVACAALNGLLEYPKAELDEVLNDLLTAQFHDILPGSSVQYVEEAGLRLIDHGLEAASRLRGRAFFALASGQPKAAEGEIPILVYNPHPFPVRGIFECEFNLLDVALNERFTVPQVFHNGERLPCQGGKETHNIHIDWRRMSVFAAELAPSSMNRFDCRFEMLPERPKPQLREQDGKIAFDNGEMRVEINAQTGLIDRYRVGTVDYLQRNAFLPMIVRDTPDAWGVRSREFREIEDVFRPMSPEEGSRFSGVTENILPSVRVVEEGEVRTIVEAVMRCRDSFVCQTYVLPQQGTEVEVQVRVYWNEKDRMLKLAIPSVFEKAECLGQTIYGKEKLPVDGAESVAQRWVALVSEDAGQALTCINDCQYGLDCRNGELRLTLLRSAAYASHYFPGRPWVLQDRFTARMDQGERRFRFWLNAGSLRERMERVDREATMHNEKPFVISISPSGEGARPKPGIVLSDHVVQLAAFKKAEASDDYIIRLFEPTGQPRTTTVEIPALSISQKVSLGAFEIKTLQLGVTEKKLTECSLTEE